MTRGRPRNEIPTQNLKLATTDAVVRDLKRLVDTGYFGKNETAAAEQILRERLRAMLREEPELFTRRKSGP
jgi:hypothetical protein